ncbi:MAG: anti-sigma factor [Actinomycetota bacterium]|nr:anti-sigma factor [Actinomycetota bacterium]
MSPLNHHDMDDLLAAYALDAVDGDEADAVDVHLRECGRCRAIVADFRATAAHLATGAEPAPVGVWDAIVAEIDTGEPRELDLGAILPMRPRKRLIRGMAIGAAAAAVVVIVGLVAQVVSQGQRLEEMQAALEDRTILSAALAAEGHPDARRTELRSADGSIFAHAVVTPDGTGFLRAAPLPPLAAGRTYQLWAVVGTERISAGLLGPDPDVVPFQVAGDVLGLAVTEEPAGGVVVTQNQPVAVGLLVEA